MAARTPIACRAAKNQRGVAEPNRRLRAKQWCSRSGGVDEAAGVRCTHALDPRFRRFNSVRSLHSFRITSCLAASVAHRIVLRSPSHPARVDTTHKAVVSLASRRVLRSEASGRKTTVSKPSFDVRPDSLVWDHFRRHALETPEREAIVHVEVDRPAYRWRWGELLRAASTVARRLAQGRARGRGSSIFDRVGIFPGRKSEAGGRAQKEAVPMDREKQSALGGT